MNLNTFYKNIKIDNYEFFSFAKKHGLSPEIKAIFKNTKTGKKVFIKTGKRSKKLTYEFMAHKLFYNLSKKTNKLIIPQPLKLIEIDNQKYLIMDNLNLKPVHGLPIKHKINYYLNVFKALQMINKRKTFNHSLKVYTPLYIFFTIPYFLIIAMLRGVSPIILFKSWFKVIKFLPKWLKLKPVYINHGDLHATNILGFDGKTALIDFGEALLSHKYYDLSIAVNTCWRTPGFCKVFFKAMLKNGLIKNEELTIFNSFAVYNLYQRLSGQVKKGQKNFYLTRLNSLYKNL